MNSLFLIVPLDKNSVLVDDIECYDGHPHVLDKLSGYAIRSNDPVYCAKCSRRLWATPLHPTWYARRRAYRIEEEPW